MLLLINTNVCVLKCSLKSMEVLKCLFLVLFTHRASFILAIVVPIDENRELKKIEEKVSNKLSND